MTQLIATETPSGIQYTDADGNDAGMIVPHWGDKPHRAIPVMMKSRTGANKSLPEIEFKSRAAAEQYLYAALIEAKAQ